LKKLILLLAVALVSVVAFAATPSQAAAKTCTTHPGGAYACVLYGHLIQVCDTQVDGHRARGWFNTWVDGQLNWITPWAPTRGCTSYEGVAGGQMSRFRVCIEYEGCTAWKSP
jgi:hypothetical protein